MIAAIDAPTSSVPGFTSKSAINVVRIAAAVFATYLFAAAFWWPGIGWYDGPPRIDYFLANFHVPLAVGLGCGAKLLTQRGFFSRFVGYCCVAVCLPGLIEILVQSLIFDNGVWFYSRI